MPAKPVQVSIDTELLRRIDQDPETRKKGRVSRRKARQEIDSRLTDAYDGQADAVLDEIAELLDRQSRPSH